MTLSWNFFHNHYKTNLIGNSDALRDVDSGHLHVTLHHNRYENCGTRGPAGRFGHQHVYNNYYEDFHYQVIHSRSDNQMLVEGNVFRGDTAEALSTYGLVIPEDSPNTCTCGDEEIDGFVNLGASEFPFPSEMSYLAASADLSANWSVGGQKTTGAARASISRRRATLRRLRTTTSSRRSPS